MKLHNLCIDEWIKSKGEGDYDFQRSFLGEVQEMGNQNANFDSLCNPYNNEEEPEDDERARPYACTPKRQKIHFEYGISQRKCGQVRQISLFLL